LKVLEGTDYTVTILSRIRELRETRLAISAEVWLGGEMIAMFANHIELTTLGVVRVGVFQELGLGLVLHESPPEMTWGETASLRCLLMERARITGIFSRGSQFWSSTNVAGKALTHSKEWRNGSF
jgi:hypothetical protein